MNNTDIEQRIHNIESELKSIKTIIDVSNQSTDIKINQYLINTFFIDYDYRDITSSIAISIFQCHRYYNEFVTGKVIYYDKEQYKEKEALDLLKHYISSTFSIPNPTIITLTINNHTYYDYIH